ncbi:Putative MSHA biogenesis protein MshH [Moritella viscosa]|uniref:EAL domain-containing protein n=1 Tax=Moritella viscosa TaxID=80854 RepID=UPI000508E2D3|nr:EAL domain-containing protein [Moritella viscosa]CED62130.1 putative membrane associated signaling protein, GGDEF family protein [Moritella viscosa]SHO07334.1 Putative MSHA biogenesis protein MshH [Moritella viscosa]SHO07430.1 Putative MSHA biogenesis protein MshH [Moritella viscosa]SHO08360.1 Putative MSHA biogenesis protein MshH [Moritella viscosa]SHO11324.1 Putative MSHA biogenesis protein MshH [Moritella viscosa]
MKFTNQLIGFIIVCVLSSIGVVLLGGGVSLRGLAIETQKQNISRLIDVMDEQLAMEDSEPRFAFWLPELLRAHSVLQLTVEKNGIVSYDFDGRTADVGDDTPFLKEYHFDLKANSDFKAKVIMLSPYYAMEYPPELFTGVSTGLLIALFGLVIAIWLLKKGMYGAELLSTRSYQILNGDHIKVAVGSGAEWPKATSRAFDKLIADLEDTKQERSRFDSYMRTNAFVDASTGIGNRDFLLNQLEAMLSDPGVIAGTIIKIELYELSQLNYNHGVASVDEMVKSVCELLSKFVERFIGSVLARYRGDQFIILLPRITGSESEIVMKQLYKLLTRISLFTPVDCDELFYTGVAIYNYAERTEEVLENVDQALKIAVLQGCSGWFLYEQEEQTPVYAKGTVRWRGLFDRTFKNNAFYYEQQLILSMEDKLVLGYEIYPRLKDENDEWVHAGVFLPMAEKCGVLKRIDRLTVERAISNLEQGEPISCGLNLDIQSYLDKRFMRAVYLDIIRLPVRLRAMLHFEIHEYQINRNLEMLLEPVKNLKALGCCIVVDMVGQDVVDSSYIKKLDVDVIKIHHSLVRDLHKRQINQLAISSILGGTINLSTIVIAVGVESKGEWDVLNKLGVYGAQGYFCNKVSLLNES